jgi:hypothetical protein
MGYSDVQAIRSSVKLSLRISGAMIVPYVELPLFTEDHPLKRSLNFNCTLKEIIYGPGLNATVTERSLQYLTSIFPQPNKISIKQSGIKVRV